MKSALRSEADVIENIRTKIGEGRPIAQTREVAAMVSQLDWVPSARGGQVAALRFVSEGAVGVRLGVLVRSLPLGGVVRFYADGDERMVEVPAQEVLAAIQANLDAGDTSDAARTYWSPNLGGEAITAEFEVPPGMPVDLVEVAVPSLSHVFTDLKSGLVESKAAGSCNQDVSCAAASSYGDVSNATAYMDFIDGDDNYMCTGTLLNDRLSSGTPYFLSANHCLSSQTAASTLWTLWFGRSATCGSTEINPDADLMLSGATLLYSSANTDTSFMRLNGTPPAGAVFAGWSTFKPDLAGAVFSVHHPQGDMQKYSRGTYGGDGVCEWRDGGLWCGPTVAANANSLRVSWWSGVTEYGSSGAGLFVRMNQRNYLVGQLSGGRASCTNRFADDYFGRFDMAYNAALHQWLGATSGTVRVPVYRLYNNNTGTHFYTPDPAERDRAVEKWREFSYEGVGFYAYGAAGLASDTVHRFYNTRTNAHFFTISAAEKASVESQYPWYLYEGTSWYANVQPTNGAVPMYRFYNTKTSTHFYTISQAERDQVIARYPEYSYEGIGYYGWTSR